jgi:hypothetical protein
VEVGVEEIDFKFLLEVVDQVVAEMEVIHIK